MGNSARLWATSTKFKPPNVLPSAIDPDKDYPPVIQTADWTCSCASMAWCMNALGVEAPTPGPWDEWDAVNELRRITGNWGAVSPEYGLAFGNGQDLERVYNAYGFEVVRELGVLWGDGALRSEQYIGQMGGGRWYHWTGTRTFVGDRYALANPAPTWKGVGQEMDSDEWAAWGSWNCLWIVGLKL